MKTVFQIVLFVVFALAVLAFPAPVAAATNPLAAVNGASQSGTNAIVTGTIPNEPNYQGAGWTPYIAENKVVGNNRYIVIRRYGKPCVVCGVSNPPFLPFSLTVPVGSKVGQKVYVNGVYRFTVQ